jgi:hypothetical protein
MFDIRDYDIPAIIISFILFIVLPIVLVVGWVWGADSIIQTNALNKAMDGCIKCEMSDENDYYMFTCDNQSYKISKQQYLDIKYNLNISECK